MKPTIRNVSAPLSLRRILSVAGVENSVAKFPIENQSIIQ